MARSRMRRTALALAGALLIGAVSGAGASAQDTQENVAVIDTAATADLLDRANSVLEQILSYDYRQLDAHQQLVTDLTTDGFRTDNAELFEAIAEQAPAQQAVVDSVVQASAARSIRDTRAEVLVYLDQTTANAASEQPVESKTVFLASFQRKDDAWLLDEIDFFEGR